MTDRSTSFGEIAADYQRYRSGPPAAALDWLLPHRVGAVADLGAGTGLLTRDLISRADEVFAVEPDERMRSVLEAEVPGATVLEGKGEAIPLPDGSVDAVLASASWHWMDPVATLGEVRRVLKPGGFLSAMWAGPDGEGPFMLQARALIRGSGDLDDTLSPERNPDWQLTIPEGLAFSDPEHQTFRWEVPLTADALVGLLATLSWVITMEEEKRADLFRTASRLLAEHLGVQGEVTVDVTYKCETFRSRPV